MSLLDIYNSVQLEDSRADSGRDRHIMELAQQADMIARKGGQQPKSWFEFQREHKHMMHEASATTPIMGAIIGGAIGVAIGAALALAGPTAPGLAAAVMGSGYIGLLGAFLGGVIGISTELSKENSAHKQVIDNYEFYLNKVEQSLSRVPAKAMEMTYRDDHAQKLDQQRELLAAMQTQR